MTFIMQHSTVIITIITAFIAMSAAMLHGYITCAEDNGVALKAGRAPRIAIRFLALSSIIILAIL